MSYRVEREIFTLRLYKIFLRWLADRDDKLLAMTYRYYLNQLVNRFFNLSANFLIQILLLQ